MSSRLCTVDAGLDWFNWLSRWRYWSIRSWLSRYRRVLDSNIFLPERRPVSENCGHGRADGGELRVALAIGRALDFETTVAGGKMTR